MKCEWCKEEEIRLKRLNQSWRLNCACGHLARCPFAHKEHSQEDKNDREYE